MNLAAPVYDRLAGDATLAALLAPYRGAPAVFTAEPPPDARLPMVVSVGNESEAPADTKTGRGLEVRRALRCYAPATGSTDQVEAVAARVRALFHRHALAVPGWRTVVAIVDGPSPAAVDPSLYGRRLVLRLLLRPEE